MKFDIHKYDQLEDELAEKRLRKYTETLVKLFLKSKEGVALLETDPGAGGWADSFLNYGYSHIGVFPTQMTRMEVEEILTDLFPRKISLASPEDADEIIPELLAFWAFLQREYQLANAGSILLFLQKIKSGFSDIMNDSSRFGMAKSFVAMGMEMGFDMTDEADMQRFMLHYNEHIANTSLEPPGIQRTLPPRQSENLKRISQNAGTRNQRKRMRKKRNR